LKHEEVLDMVEIKALVRILTRCNIKCRHCYVYTNDTEDFQLNIDQLKMIIDKLVGIKTNSIVFTGGQPTLAGNDLVEIIKYTKIKKEEIGYPKRIEVTTNSVIGKDEGTARQWLSDFQNAGLDRIRLSADAYHREFLPKEYEDRVIDLAGEYGIAIKVMEVAGPGNRIDSNIETKDKKCFALRPGGRANSEELRSAWDNTGSCRIARAYKNNGEKITLFIHSTGDVMLCNVGVDRELSFGNALYEEFGDILSRRKSGLISSLMNDVAGLGTFLGLSESRTEEMIKQFGRCGACGRMRRGNL